MASYLLDYNILIRIWHHIYWNMTYLLEYDIIFIGIWHHIYWNMESYLLECGISFYWNIASYLLQYDIIFIGILHHFYWNMTFFGMCHHIYKITSVKFLGGIPPNNSKNIDI